MKKSAGIVMLLLAVVFTSASFVFSQATRNPPSSKKANRRHAEEKKKEKPKLKNNSEVVVGPTEEDDEILTIETALVTIPVRVLDRQGRFVGGLKKEEFSVFEDRQPQQIEYFSNEQSPFTVALVLDMSYSSKFKIDEIQQAALTFINELRPKDKVMVVSFDGQFYVLSEPTSDRKVLQNAIIKTEIGSGTSLYETVDFVLNKRFNKIQGRKAIVLFTDGVDTTSRQAHDRNNLDDALEYEALIYPIRYDTYQDVKAIESGKVVIKDTGTKTTPPIGGGGIPTGRTTKSPLPFPLPTGTIGTGRTPRSLPGSGTSKEEYRKAEEYLDEMARRTGGRVYEANNPITLSRAFSQIASELREFYSIGYYPEDSETSGKRRRIKVKVDRKKVAVKTRSSYVFKKKQKNKK